MIPRQTELGLTPRTKALLANPPSNEFGTVAGRPTPIIGPTPFLRRYVSTEDWVEFPAIIEIAMKVDQTLNIESMHAILCDLVKRGEFEIKKKDGHRNSYRRIPKEVPIAPVVKLVLVSQRKFKSTSW